MFKTKLLSTAAIGLLLCSGAAYAAYQDRDRGGDDRQHGNAQTYRGRGNTATGAQTNTPSGGHGPYQGSSTTGGQGPQGNGGNWRHNPAPVTNTAPNTGGASGGNGGNWRHGPAPVTNTTPNTGTNPQGQVQSGGNGGGGNWRRDHNTTSNGGSNTGGSNNGGGNWRRDHNTTSNGGNVNGGGGNWRRDGGGDANGGGNWRGHQDGNGRTYRSGGGHDYRGRGTDQRYWGREYHRPLYRDGHYWNWHERYELERFIFGWGYVRIFNWWLFDDIYWVTVTDRYGAVWELQIDGYTGQVIRAIPIQPDDPYYPGDYDGPSQPYPY